MPRIALLPLLAVTALSAGGSSVLFGPPAEVAGSTTPVPVASHVTWQRMTSFREIARAAELVVEGTVVGNEEGPPITAKTAKAAAGFPDIPQRLITLSVESTYLGDAARTVRFLHSLPPGGTPLEEDPAYRLGSRELLFLRDEGPESVWVRTGIDGRFPVVNGEFQGLLPNGPADEVRAARGSLREKIKEARQ